MTHERPSRSQTAVATHYGDAGHSLRLAYRDRAAFLTMYWQKAGDAGLFVPGVVGFGVGESVQLELCFEAPRMVFHCSAVVRWRRAAGNDALPAGLGVSLAADAKTHAVLWDFVQGRNERPLLMRRKRLPVGLAVRCIADGQARLARTANLSEGGAFILSARPPVQGTLVSLSLGHDEKHSVDLDAEVMWRCSAGAASGFGVRFLLRNASTRQSVSDILQQVEVTRR